MCKLSVISYLFPIRGYLERQVIKSSWCQAAWVWGKLEGPRAGRAVAQAAAAASEAGSEKCGKVIDQICLSFSCCSIPPVFPHGLSRSHLGSLSQMDFFSPSVPLMMVRENDSSIREVCYFTTWSTFSLFLLCSCWSFLNASRGKDPSVLRFRVTSGFSVLRNELAPEPCWYPIHAQKGIPPE